MKVFYFHIVRVSSTSVGQCQLNHGKCPVFPVEMDVPSVTRSTLFQGTTPKKDLVGNGVP